MHSHLTHSHQVILLLNQHTPLVLYLHLRRERNKWHHPLPRSLPLRGKRSGHQILHGARPMMMTTLNLNDVFCCPYTDSIHKERSYTRETEEAQSPPIFPIKFWFRIQPACSIRPLWMRWRDCCRIGCSAIWFSKNWWHSVPIYFFPFLHCVYNNT